MIREKELKNRRKPPGHSSVCQDSAIEQALIKMENEKAIFFSHKYVEQWLASWGTDREAEWTKP